MIREDREPLAEPARIDGDMTSLGLRIIEGSASATEQQHYAERLIAAGNLLRVSIAPPAHAVKPDWKP